MADLSIPTAIYPYNFEIITGESLMFTVSIRIAGLLVCLFVSSVAFAHAPVVSTNIANGATLDTAPESFTIAFGGQVGLASLTVKDASGTTLNTGSKLPRSMQSDFNVPLPTLGTGQYKIEWRTMSTDGHVMTDHIEFTVK